MILTQPWDRLSKNTETDIPQGSIIRKGRSQLDEIYARAAKTMPWQQERGHQISKKAESIK